MTGIYGDVTVNRSAGAVRPTDPPAAQPFWLASVTGTGILDLRWIPGDGRIAIVLANADGRTGVSVEATVGARVPVLRPLGNALVAGGAVAVWSRCC